MQDTDEGLFLKWQQGDTQALELLVQKYHAPLLMHLSHLVKDIHLVEDLVQDTFLHLVRDKHLYHYPRPFKPWIFTIARRLALNLLKSAQYRYEKIEVDISCSSTEILDVEDWLEQLERRDILKHSLSLLSFEHREILSLRFGLGLSIQEAAEALGIATGTVKSRTFHALQTLRNHLLPDAKQKERLLGGSHGYTW